MKERSFFHQFATPHTFAPNLSVGEAVVAVAGAMTRIFLGSSLFAVWGVYSFLAWKSIESPLLRIVAVPLLVAPFLALMAGLMLGISAATKWITRKLQ